MFADSTAAFLTVYTTLFLLACHFQASTLSLLVHFLILIVSGSLQAFLIRIKTERSSHQNVYPFLGVYIEFTFHVPFSKFSLELADSEVFAFSL